MIFLIIFLVLILVLTDEQKGELKMWKYKECGGTEFIERVVGGYEKYSGYGKDGYCRMSKMWIY